MTDNEIIKALECCVKTEFISDCAKCEMFAFDCKDTLIENALDLINRQKAEIGRLNKNYEELIYKTECLLCHATGNKFSKYTYTTQEMLSFVDDYIQDCCDEAIEETKATVKSEAIKEFAEELEYFVLNEDMVYALKIIFDLLTESNMDVIDFTHLLNKIVVQELIENKEE